MNVQINSLLSGAIQATGVVVIIDVFRAFTTAAVAIAQGAKEIILVSSAEEALALRGSAVAHACMGEVRGRRPEGFDFGNSPFEVSRARMMGQTIVLRTSAGTQGVVNASQAQKLYCGSLVTAEATTAAIARDATKDITLVAMGENGETRADEDELCAIHLRNRLEGRSSNRNAIRELILASARISDFSDSMKSHLHPQDLEIALDIDRFNFAIGVSVEEARPVARKVRI
ncbi:MAG: 2-phosphosulfolactate phosphatase [Hyphomicrobiaceae bacterium]